MNFNEVILVPPAGAAPRRACGRPGARVLLVDGHHVPAVAPHEHGPGDVRQLYRCVVGGNARAREHWKRAGVDPHMKIESKYSSPTAHAYKSLLEKDVAEACRRGLAT